MGDSNGSFTGRNSVSLLSTSYADRKREFEVSESLNDEYTVLQVLWTRLVKALKYGLIVEVRRYS